MELKILVIGWILNMLIKRQSPVTGQINEREIDVTEQQMQSFKNGAMIQDAFPSISASDREFILSGMTDEDWTHVFGEEEA